MMAHASVAGLAGGSLFFAAPAAALPTFEAYHDVTSAKHQENLDRLSRHGFRPISLSVYGGPPNERYAAVWVKRTGPAYATVHGLGAGAYQTALDSWRSKGYAPAIVTATGSGSNAVFAAVFEQSVPEPWLARHNIDESRFNAECRQAFDVGQKLRWVSIYGTPSDRRFIAVWHSNPGFAKWHAIARVSSGGYQAVFDAQTQLPGFRPACVSVASDHSLCAIFTDESIGPYVARHDMTGADYQSEFNRQRSAGRLPICVQGGGAGSAIRYAAIFASRDQPLARTWTVSGNGAANMGAFDTLMRTFMTKQAVRAAQLTVAQNGIFLLRRAYTWAEPGYHVTQTTDRFLLASNSKMFVAAAIQRLYDIGRLQPSARAYPLLGFSHPKDARSDTITIQQLLDHSAGYTFDPTYDMRNIALSRNLTGPAGKRDIAAYMYARDLDYPPGQPPNPGGVYNNYGFLLLSLVVEQVSGQDYFQFLSSQVLQPDGIADVAVYPTARSPRADSLICAEDDGLGLSALAPTSNVQVPVVYGGDGMVKETAVGSCGLAASATALTQFIRRHAVMGIGGRTLGSRDGSTPGATTWAESRDTGADWSLAINTRRWVPGMTNVVMELVRSVRAELSRGGL